MGPIETGNSNTQTLMILCVRVGLVIATTFRAKNSPVEVSVPWQRWLCKNRHFGQKFHWQGTEFKKCWDLCVCLDLFVQSSQTTYLWQIYDPCLLKLNTDIGNIYYQFFCFFSLYLLLNFSKFCIFWYFGKNVKLAFFEFEFIASQWQNFLILSLP